MDELSITTTPGGAESGPAQRSELRARYLAATGGAGVPRHEGDAEVA